MDGLDPALLPATIQLQVQVESSKYIPVELPMNRGLDKPVTMENAMRHLTLLMEQMWRRAGLRETVIRLATGTNNNIHVTNRAFKNAGFTLELAFPPNLSKALGLKEDQILSFNMEVIRAYELRVQQSVPNPFEGRFPVHMCGYGQASSYIEKFGTVALFGLINRSHITSDGALFQGDRTYITLEFIDNYGERVVFEHDYMISMQLTFKHC